MLICKIMELKNREDKNQFINLVENELEWLFKGEFLVKVAIYEAFNNAVDHGSFPIKIQLNYEQDTLMVSFKDNGTGFPFSGIDEDHITNESLLEERGRGLYIMKQVMDELIINEQGNEVTLVKYFKDGNEVD